MTERDPRDHDQQQIRDMHLVFEHVKQGLMTEMAARPVMMEILTRPIRRQAMTERQLIRDVRAEVMSWSCACGGPGVEMCTRCTLLKLIDDGLAQIGKEPNSAAELKRKSGELMRSGNMGAAIRLYNRAWDKERHDGHIEGT